jgi:hypothetical protein
MRVLPELHATPIAQAREGLVLLAGRVVAREEPLTPLWPELGCVAYRLRWPQGDETRLSPFWLEDETGRALIEEGPLLLDLPVEGLSLPAPAPHPVRQPAGSSGMEHYRLQRVSAGDYLYALGEVERFPDPGGAAGLYRELPMGLRLRGHKWSPIVLSAKPFGPQTALVRLSRLLRFIFSG